MSGSAIAPAVIGLVGVGVGAGLKAGLDLLTEGRKHQRETAQRLRAEQQEALVAFIAEVADFAYAVMTGSAETVQALPWSHQAYVRVGLLCPPELADAALDVVEDMDNLEQYRKDTGTTGPEAPESLRSFADKARDFLTKN